MEEITSELKHLIKLQRQRPAFARTISWEFSQSEDGQKKRKSKKKAKEASQGDGSIAVDDDIDDAIAGTDDVLTDMVESSGRQHRLSTIESVGDSESSDDSEYYSALEDEIDESVTTEDTFDTIDSLGDSIVDSADRLDDESAGEAESLDSFKTQAVSDVGNTGRRRRPSKKQRKRRKESRVTFANEIMSMADIFDVSEDIDLAITETTEGDAVSSINRQIPSLVQLCMSVTARKVESKEKATLPFGMRKLVSGWNKKQGLLQKQLSWLQNHLLPVTDNADNLTFLCLFNKRKEGVNNYLFLYPTRSVWNGFPKPVHQHWNEDGSYNSGQAVSFLLALSLNHKDKTENLNWEYQNYCSYQALRSMCNLSAFATAIDLMLPAFVTQRSLGGRNVTEQELFSKAFKTMLYRVRLALKSRFPRIVDELFDRALSYVMWARGNVTMATEMFNNLILKEKRSRQKAMHLSEIARMNCEFDETETAIKFYRLAAETAIGKPKHNDKDIEEVTEQTQVLLACVHDSGVITPEKARQSTACWNGALNLPKQKLQTAVMAIESFLCFHATHFTDTCWQEEALAKIQNVEQTHQYLKFHASMILALQGKDKESRLKYRESLNGSSHSPGHALLTILGRSKIKNVWQPLIDIVINNKTPLKLLKVVWRRQFGTPGIYTGERPEEGQICSRALNLHINSDGYLTGDIQNVLPPQRDISLDPYTGSTIITHVPSLTAPLQTCYLSYMFEGLHIPTPQIIYSSDSGTTVTMMKPSKEPCTKYIQLPSGSPPEPFVLHWQNSCGQSAKINVLRLVKDSLRERCLSELSKRPAWLEEKKTKIRELMQVFYDNNKQFDIFYLERKYNEGMKQKKKDKKMKKAPKRSKKSLLADANPVSATLTDEPRIYGETVVLFLKDHLSVTHMLFVNTEDKKSFLDSKLLQSNEKHASQGRFRGSPHQEEFFITCRGSGNEIKIYNKNGVLVECMKDAVSDPSPCIIGPYVYLNTMDKLSIWKHMIGEDESLDEEERQVERVNTTAWAFAEYWPLLSATEDKKIHSMMIVGQQTGDTGNVLMVHTSVGLCFMDPETLNLLPVTMETKSPPPYQLSEDSKVLILQRMGEVKLRAEKTYTVDNKQITKLAVAAENNILVFQLECEFQKPSAANFSGNTVASTRVKLIMSVALPGFAKEACFVGKEVGLLVSTTMYVRGTDYYRENLFYFKLDGHCYGLLPCLGHGKRSFHPVYLHGNKGEGHQPGWYVYMRDGHNGIICVQLHDSAL